MKRELAFALEAQSQLIGSFGRTRSSKALNSALNGVSEKSSKRVKGFAVHESGLNGSINGSQQKSETNGLIYKNEEKEVITSQSNEISVYTRNKRFKSATVELEVNESVVETVNRDDLECNLATPVCEVDNGVNLAQASVMEELVGGTEIPAPKEGVCEAEQVVVDQKRKKKKVVPVNAPRRFTRSALKANVEAVECLVSVPIETGILEANVEAVECLVSGPVETGVLDSGNSEAVLEVEGNETGAVSALGTPTKKLELKMSKKITLTKQPTTVRELFETGLLEGYSVYYNGGKKGTALSGVVKGIGILCSCNLCKGYRVVTPCQFEIHACQSYRRAAQYICLENGKNLLQVVKACKSSPLDTLEETIQSAIGSLPVRESIVCQNCKGSFIATVASKFGQFCDSCLELKDLQSGPTQTAGPSTRSSKPDLVLKRSSRIAKVGILSENNSQEKIPKTSSKPASVSKSSESALVSSSSQNTSKGKREKKSSKSAWVLKSPGSASERISSQNKSRGKITKNLLKPTLVSKSSRSASVHITSANGSLGKIRKKSSKSVLIPRSSKSAPLRFSSQKKRRWKITKKDLRLHKLVFEEGALPDGTELAYYSNGQKLLQGYKKGLGIFCYCCRTEVSASTFEAHAGWASRRKPYGYIYTSNGVSLHELAISLLKGREKAARDNDDLCIICADGGNLLLCDGCPRAFHIECASLTSIPRGKWYCQYCQNMFLREKFVEHNANAVAAGRISGVDPIEQITKRCIRIIKNPEEVEAIACVLCRGYDFSKSGFGELTVILCDQCEREYHVGCLKKNKMADLEELPKGKWFCSMDCQRISCALQNLLIRGEEKLPDSLLDVLKKKHEEKDPGTVFDFDVRWRVLSGKIASRETRLLLSKAVAIFHECFDPIVDLTTGQDFIPSMVYGRNLRGQDYGGMYCAVLTVNSSVVSAAILRVFGCEVAELPLVATSNGNQGKGYFQILFSCIERLLAFLNVRTFVLPAAEEAESIWTQKFGFEKIPSEQLDNFRKDVSQMMTFKGTSMLQKKVPQCRMIVQDD